MRAIYEMENEFKMNNILEVKNLSKKYNDFENSISLYFFVNFYFV